MVAHAGAENFQSSGSSLNGNAGALIAESATLHHIGIVVDSITQAAQRFALAMSCSWDGRIIHDPLQRVRVSFLSPADARNPVYELVEPAREDSPVSNFLKKTGGGIHHVCYEVNNLDLGLKKAKDSGFVVVSAPSPAVAFSGRRIAWVWSRDRLLVEFLERDKNNAQ